MITVLEDGGCAQRSVRALMFFVDFLLYKDGGRFSFSSVLPLINPQSHPHIPPLLIFFGFSTYHQLDFILFFKLSQQHNFFFRGVQK